MYIDALGLVSNAQAFGAGPTVSTSSVDLGNVTPKRKVGTGEPVGFGFVVTTSATVADPIVEIISATDDVLTTAILVEARVTLALLDAVAGYGIFIAIPPGRPRQRYVGLRVTTAGGTVSGTAWLTTHSLFSILAASYAKGYVNT